MSRTQASTSGSSTPSSSSSASLATPGDDGRRPGRGAALPPRPPRARPARRCSTRPRAVGGSASRGTSSGVPRGTGRSRRITGRPPEPRRAGDHLGLASRGEEARADREPAWIVARALDEEARRRGRAGGRPARRRPCSPSLNQRSRRGRAGPARRPARSTSVRSARTIRPPRPITLPTSSGATWSTRTSAPSRSTLSTRTASGSSTSSQARYASSSAIVV